MGRLLTASVSVFVPAMLLIGTGSSLVVACSLAPFEESPGSSEADDDDDGDDDDDDDGDDDDDDDDGDDDDDDDGDDDDGDDDDGDDDDGDDDDGDDDDGDDDDASCPDLDLEHEFPIDTHDDGVAKSNTFEPSCDNRPRAERRLLWTAPEGGNYRVVARGADDVDLDTVLYVLDGACEGEELACSDDIGTGKLHHAAVDLDLEADQTVTLVVEAHDDAIDGFDVKVGPALRCSQLGDALPGSTQATLDPTIGTWESERCGGKGPELAFVWTAPNDGVFQFDSLGSLFDTVLYALDGSCDGRELACSDDFPGSSRSRLTLALRQDETVTLVVDGAADDDIGELSLNVSPVECPEDELEVDVGRGWSAPAIDRSGKVEGTTVNGTDTLTPTCGGGTSGVPDKVFSWRVPESGKYTLDTFGSQFDTVLWILRNDCLGSELACNDDANGSDDASALVVELDAGDELIVGIEGFEPGDEGKFVLNVAWEGERSAAWH